MNILFLTYFGSILVNVSTNNNYTNGHIPIINSTFSHGRQTELFENTKY